MEHVIFLPAMASIRVGSGWLAGKPTVTSSTVGTEAGNQHFVCLGCSNTELVIRQYGKAIRGIYSAQYSSLKKYNNFF